jgi:hypothetical protein
MIALVLRIILALGLFVLAGAKFTSQYHPVMLLPPKTYLCVAALEVMLGGLVLRQSWSWLGACGTILLGISGIATTYLVPTGHCGCLGGWAALGPTERVVLSSLMCLLAGLVLVLRTAARPEMASADLARSLEPARREG